MTIIPSNSVQIPTHMFSCFLQLDPKFPSFSTLQGCRLWPRWELSFVWSPPTTLVSLTHAGRCFERTGEFGLVWVHAWNPKQPFINGCFNWMIPNLYIENGCFTKHPFINGCLGFQVSNISHSVHVLYIYTYMKTIKTQPTVGKYNTSPMDGMGMDQCEYRSKRNHFNLHELL